MSHFFLNGIHTGIHIYYVIYIYMIQYIPGPMFTLVIGGRLAQRKERLNQIAQQYQVRILTRQTKCEHFKVDVIM